MEERVSLVPRPSLAPVFDRLQYAKTEGEGLANLIRGTHDVTGFRHEDMFIYISSYREARQTRQVPAKRQVLPLQHTRIWNRTAEGWFHCFFATLAKFCHCRYFTHVVQQPFGAIPSSLDMHVLYA